MAKHKKHKSIFKKWWLLVITVALLLVFIGTYLFIINANKVSRPCIIAITKYHTLYNTPELFIESISVDSDCRNNVNAADYPLNQDTNLFGYNFDRHLSFCKNIYPLSLTQNDIINGSYEDRQFTLYIYFNNNKADGFEKNCIVPN